MWCTFKGGRRPNPKNELARRLTGSEFARVKLGFEADPKQALVLDCVARQGMLNCSRQWGKSTVTAAKAVHRAWSEPRSTVLVASPSERQSREFLRKAAEFVQKLGVRPRGDGDNAASLLFPNGSRIVGLPGNESTVRGFSAVSLLLIDEASRVPDELFKALHPVLAVSRGDVWLMSTPYGQRGFFWDFWTRGGPEWERFSGLATECSRIPAEFLEQERKIQGSTWFAQEYMCEFVDNGSRWFGREMVERAWRDEAPLEL